jgi:hypothetical protein
MFDFGLFLTVTIAIFSIISIGCIGLGAYAVLRNNTHNSSTCRATTMYDLVGQNVLGRKYWL